jgi:hypothetical protein
MKSKTFEIRRKFLEASYISGMAEIEPAAFSMRKIAGEEKWCGLSAAGLSPRRLL